MIYKRHTDSDGIKWEARIDYDGHTTIIRNGKRFDTGWDDGAIIHHADRTPESILTALDNAPNEDS